MIAISTITTKKIGLGQSYIKEVIKRQEVHKLDIFSVNCIVKSYSIVTTNYGESCKFYGLFVVKNLITDDIYQSPQMFLPGVLERLAQNAVDGTQSEGPNTTIDININGTVSVILDGDDYEYTYSPKETDPSTKLLAENL